MPTYRPITDFWMLARAKLKDGHKYYGAYPGGFLERARALVGASVFDPVLHVCGGMVRHYPYPSGFGVNDRTMDLDPETEPDYLQDARDSWPTGPGHVTVDGELQDPHWRAVLADPPYTEGDADKYVPGAGVLPKPNEIMKRRSGGATCRRARRHPALLHAGQAEDAAQTHRRDRRDGRIQQPDSHVHRV